jgi:DNA methylase
VLLFVPRGAVVLDPFWGSGTVGAAAILQGRRAIRIERDPAMRGWIERRIETATAMVKPVLISGNRSKESLGTALTSARRAIERMDRVDCVALSALPENVFLCFVGCAGPASTHSVDELVCVDISGRTRLGSTMRTSMPSARRSVSAGDKIPQ